LRQVSSTRQVLSTAAVIPGGLKTAQAIY
jgi:hypothetical protein